MLARELKPAPAARERPTTEALLDLYRSLYTHFGPQGWWPARTAFEVVVGAILTQSCAWVNVEKAIAALGQRGLLEPRALREADIDELARLIRPAGYFNVKARKLKAFVDHLHRFHGGDLRSLFAGPLERVRQEILGIYGIGPETADSILLYAGGLPTFVIDAYTMRIMQRLGFWSPIRAPGSRAAGRPDYEDLRGLFMHRLPPDTELYKEYHALFVAQGKNYCRKATPRCAECPLAACPVGHGVRNSQV